MLASLKVKDYMSANKCSFTPDMDILQAIHHMLESHISGGPVIDEHGNMVGFLSEKDRMQVALNAAYQQAGAAGRVSEFMSPDIITVDIDTAILEIAELFLKGSFKRYPIVTDNRLVGTITRQDVLRALEQLSVPDDGHKIDRQSTKQKVNL